MNFCDAKSPELADRRERGIALVVPQGFKSPLQKRHVLVTSPPVLAVSRSRYVSLGVVVHDQGKCLPP